MKFMRPLFGILPVELSLLRTYMERSKKEGNGRLERIIPLLVIRYLLCYLAGDHYFPRAYVTILRQHEKSKLQYLSKRCIQLPSNCFHPPN